MHMGTQYGILTRIMATAACLGILTSIVTATLMWWKRRPTGGAGLPGATSDTMRSKTHAVPSLPSASSPSLWRLSTHHSA